MIDEFERYVIGVDGGLSTGVAILRDVELFAVYQGPWESALEWLDDVATRLHTRGGDVVVVAERFRSGVGSVRASAQPHAGRVYAAAEDLARRLGVEFAGQGPAEAKRLAPNHVLRRVGLYLRGDQVGCPDANDVNDAIRHAILFLARRRASVFTRLLNSEP